MKMFTTRQITQSNTIEDIDRHYRNDTWINKEDIEKRLLDCLSLPAMSCKDKLRELMIEIHNHNSIKGGK